METISELVSRTVFFPDVPFLILDLFFFLVFLLESRFMKYIWIMNTKSKYHITFTNSSTWNVYQEVFRKITNFQLLERKCYEVFKKDGVSKKRVCRATILLRLHSSARTFKIQVQFFIRANFQNISKLTLNHFHKVNVNNSYGKCFS